ncbi:MAG: Fe-S cluster assembly protein NifU [Victivallales bacterium]|nr:Fe-S cluster assembly protein NifU [Victivallales bacterium]
MWKYTDKVMDYFLNPRNVGEIEDADAVAEVGNITCGDALKLYLKLDENGRIADAKFKTFGCVSAIASSSALTELIKGKTLDEAAKITNQDIVAVLGSLPQEKMHCSVMWMEAMHAAIGDYKKRHGIKVDETEDNDDHEGRIVCKCFNVTENKIRRIALANNLHTVAEITDYTKAGGACGRCLDDIQMILDDLWHKQGAGAAQTATAPKVDFEGLSAVKKILLVNEVIDKEIRPQLAQDGGGVEFIDLNGNEVQVRLTGHCSCCPHAAATLKGLVEEKLHELVSPGLVVKEA